MQKTLANRVRISPDTSESACNDWFGCGLQGGFRQAEWCQPSGAGLLDRFQQIQGTTECLAFTLSDITFYGEGKMQLKMDVLDQDTSIIQHVHLQF